MASELFEMQNKFVEQYNQKMSQLDPEEKDSSSKSEIID